MFAFAFIRSAVTRRGKNRVKPSKPAKERTFPGGQMGVTILDTFLSIALAGLLVGAIVLLGFTIANPKEGEKFTEFYLLGVKGKAADYPLEMVVGEKAGVTVGIANREGEPVTYRVDVSASGLPIGGAGPVWVDAGEVWEQTVAFKLTTAGTGQRVDFRLYRDDAREAMLETYLFINVAGAR